MHNIDKCLVPTCIEPATQTTFFCLKCEHKWMFSQLRIDALGLKNPKYYLAVCKAWAYMEVSSANPWAEWPWEVKPVVFETQNA